MKFKGEDIEIYDDLTTTSGDTNYVETRIDGVSKYITIEPPAGGTVSRPTNGSYDLRGEGQWSSKLTQDDILGNKGLQAFDPVDDINILAIPDSVALALADLKNIIIGAYGYCENRKDCFCG